MAAALPLCYHGAISKEECEVLLGRKKKDGAYLLRDSETIQGAMCLCVYKRRVVYTYRVLQNHSGQYTLLRAGGAEDMFFKTLDDMIQHYKRKNQGLAIHLRHSLKRKTALLIQPQKRIETLSEQRPGQRPPEQRPPEQRPPGQRPPEQRPPEQRPPGQRPPEQRPPGQRPPGQRPPGQRPPEQRPPEQRPPGQRPPGQRPPGQRHPEKRVPEQQPRRRQVPLPEEEEEDHDYENESDYVEVLPDSL